MSEKACPWMNLATSFLYANPNVETREIKVNSNDCMKDDCQLWDSGDCGLKVARDDRYERMWEEFKTWVHCQGRGTVHQKSYEFVSNKMDRIEAEMGKD